jgi:integrase
MSKSTQGIYLRSLRAIFNEAIADGIITKEKCYPFGRRKYQIPTARNVKKALKVDQIEKIYFYEPTCESESRAKAFWLFCYFANGINPKDVALLKYKNIQGEYLVFDRAKTERTARTEPKPITIYVNEDMAAIIRELGNKDKNPERYIFPILYDGVTPLRQYDLIQLFIRSINDWMVKICEKLGIDKKATTIVTRHSFSTIMKNAGASTEFIQEALGHTDKRTTENYLDSFEKEIKKEFSAKLLPFKKHLEESKHAATGS